MKYLKFAVTGGSAVLLLLCIVIVQWYPVQISAGLLLIAFLPGYALLSFLWPSPANHSAFSPLEQWLLAPALSFAVTITLLLLLVFAGQPLGAVSVAGGLSGLTLTLSFGAWWRRARGDNSASENDLKQQRTSYSQRLRFNSKTEITWITIILLLAAVFRLVNVHYSDFQGDEADIMLRAVSLVYGDSEALLTHSKGPGEILILNAMAAITGRFDEQTARLPFSLAGTISVGLILWLGWQLFNRATGIIAGLLATVDGTFVSYARTAQYQSVVLLLSLAAIGCYYRFYQTGGVSRRWHSLGTFLLAASFLMHFETVLLLPLFGYLTLAGLEWNWPGRFNHNLARLWPSAVIFVITTTLFYLPFVLHPNLLKTGSYLESRIGGGSSPPFNNFDHFFYREALKYNSAYYVALFDLLLIAAAIIALTAAWPAELSRRQNSTTRNHTQGKRIRGALSFAVLLALIGTGLTLTGQSKLAALVVGLGLAVFFAIVILSPDTSVPHKTVWLWVAPPFLTYVFLVNRPGKHHYLFLAALIILVSLMVIWLWHWATLRWPWLSQSASQRLTIGLASLLLLTFAGFTVMVFLRTDLEYTLTYPDHKSSLYPTDAAYPYGTRIGFGYPFRLGWQVMGQLRRIGQLDGTWAGNDDGNAPRWYMLATSPTPCYPDFVFRGEITYKGVEDYDVPFNPGDFGYIPRYRIWGNDRLRMTVFEFDPLADKIDLIDLYETSHFLPPATAADFADSMAAKHVGEPTPAVLSEPPLVLGEGSELKNNAPAAYLEQAKELAGRVALIGYDLDTRYARPGGIVPVTLYWRAQNLLSLRYKVFVHLVSSDGKLWTQADDFPVCGTSHANTWQPGTLVLDRHLLKIPPDLLPGDYTLVIGMYEPDLNLRLNYFDSAGNEQGNSLRIGTVSIAPKSGDA